MRRGCNAHVTITDKPPFFQAIQDCQMLSAESQMLMLQKEELQRRHRVLARRLALLEDDQHVGEKHRALTVFDNAQRK